MSALVLCLSQIDDAHENPHEREMCTPLKSRVPSICTHGEGGACTQTKHRAHPQRFRRIDCSAAGFLYGKLLAVISHCLLLQMVNGLHICIIVCAYVRINVSVFSCVLSYIYMCARVVCDCALVLVLISMECYGCFYTRGMMQ